MIAVVVKAFTPHRPGALVDTSNWRNTTNQLRARHIRPASASELALYEKGERNISPAAKPSKKDAKTASAAAQSRHV